MGQALLHKAASHFPVRGGDADMGHRGKQFLRLLMCFAILAYIMTIKAC